jgi:hypothetical protein
VLFGNHKGETMQKRIPRPSRLLETGRAPAVIVAASILAVALGGAVAIAQNDSGAETAGRNDRPLLLGQQNGTQRNPITGQTILFANNSEYALRESNLSDSGGGAIHGCRTQAPPPNASSPGDKPCLRANNLSSGQAFQFQSTTGTVGGRIQVGGTDITQVNPNAVPFETNAAGMVNNLFAERANTANTATNATNATNATTAQTANTVANGAITGPKLAGITKRRVTMDVATGANGTVDAACEAGEVMLTGGGGWLGGNATDAYVTFSGQVNTPNTWRVHARNDSGATRTLEAQVLCLAA